jgi:hypothetical protein
MCSGLEGNPCAIAATVQKAHETQTNAERSQFFIAMFSVTRLLLFDYSTR